MMNATTTNNMLTADDITTMFDLAVKLDAKEFDEYLKELGFVDIPDVNDDDDIYI